MQFACWGVRANLAPGCFARIFVRIDVELYHWYVIVCCCESVLYPDPRVPVAADPKSSKCFLSCDRLLDSSQRTFVFFRVRAIVDSDASSGASETRSPLSFKVCFKHLQYKLQIYCISRKKKEFFFGFFFLFLEFCFSLPWAPFYRKVNVSLFLPHEHTNNSFGKVVIRMLLVCLPPIKWLRLMKAALLLHRRQWPALGNRRLKPSLRVKATLIRYRRRFTFRLFRLDVARVCRRASFVCRRWRAVNRRSCVAMALQ